MRKKILITSLVLIVILVGVFLYIRAHKNDPRIIAEDTTINKDYIIDGPVQLIIQNNATLTVLGDMTIDGNAMCSDGKFSLVVTGTLRLNGRIDCVLTEQARQSTSNVGITIAAKHFESNTNSAINTNGHIDIVSDPKQFISDNTERARRFAGVLEKSANTTSVGPLLENTDAPQISSFETADQIAPVISSTDTSPTLIARGEWRIENANSKESGAGEILIHLDYGPDGSILFQQLKFVGANGSNGKNDNGFSCDAKGENGGSASRLSVHAKNIQLDNATITLGDGGDGSNVTTKNDCDNGRAVGGDGGESGNLIISATERIYISGLEITPGKGGNGGDALAYGKNGESACPGTNGGSAEAIGGNGNSNRKNLILSQNIVGITKITMNRLDGGSGGNATSIPGNGGDGNGCNCSGGEGGNGSAVGGNGANADGTLPSGTVEAHGGDGGNATAKGGDGGIGGNCERSPSGGNGGDGGDASVTIGKAGKGKTVNGNDGSIKNASGGIGGSGGAGCGPGLGGKGGIGNPLGVNGGAGIISCAPGETFEGDTRKAPTPTATKEALIKAIIYHGKYLPLDQLTVSNEPGCGAGHWRGESETVLATDGTELPDLAGSPCGFGKVSETPVYMVPPKPHLITQ